MLVQPPVVFVRRSCAGIQRGARPPVDHTMVLVEIRAQYTILIDPQMQELQPVVLVAEYRRSGRVCALPFESTQRAHAHNGAASGFGRGMPLCSISPIIHS